MQNGAVLSKRPSHQGVESSDKRLLERVAAGDRLAMEVLYTRHHLRTYRFVLRLVNDAATAEDLTSDVFLDVWKQADRFEGRSQVSTWMLAIARYKAMSALRHQADDPIDGEIASEVPESADNPEVIVQKHNESAVLRQCLRQLSPTHREVIDLVYYHEKSVAEVAAITGVPPNTVKTRMFHARKRIADLLDARGAVSHSAAGRVSHSVSARSNKSRKYSA
jgi:RNA polymerase sigma-70 factor, ECF subfamily